MALYSCEPISNESSTPTKPQTNTTTSPQFSSKEKIKQHLNDTSDILEDNSIAFLWKSSNAQHYNQESHARGFSGASNGTLFNAVVTEKPSAKPQPQAPAQKNYKSQTYQWQESSSSRGGFDNEDYDHITANRFESAEQLPVSTLSIDVDNASYSNTRRFLATRRMPPADAVRIEELVNYFNYDYPQPTDEHPFSINMEIGPSPWNADHHLIHVGLQGKELDYDQIKPSNLVFLIDASGSMNAPNKLPLLQQSFELLLNQMGKKDKISIVSYAGSAGLVLAPTPANQKRTILDALNNIKAGGSTAGGEGIHLAYKLAKENLLDDGNNRVILATDGDFNVGVSDNAELVRIIEEKRKDNIYLTICGFGMGNYKDSRMEQISNAGNGNYFYIDNIDEAKKVFIKQMRANMFTLAKDVKIQVEFNPNFVKAYRLIGYENRLLAQEDFDDDSKDAGELGAGHTVTAIYEVILSDSKSTQAIERTKNKSPKKAQLANNTSDLMQIRFRYKPEKSNTSILISNALAKGTIPSMEETSDNFRFSAAVAAYGMLLRDSEFKGNADYDLVARYAKSALGKDVDGYRTEFLRLVKSAKELSFAWN